MGDAEHRAKELHFKVFVPIGIQGFLDNRGGVRLLGIDRDYSKGIWKLEDIPLE